MESAIFGLIGVGLGALLTFFREWWLQSRKEKKDVELLAVQVSCILDRFAAECSQVVSDEGCFEQMSCNGAEYLYATTSEPKLDFSELKLEWKFLPTKLMHKILRLPFEVESASKIVAEAREYLAMPPFFEEYWGERQYRYAKLGIQAMDLAEELRNYVELEENPEEVTLHKCPSKSKLVFIPEFRKNVVQVSLQG